MQYSANKSCPLVFSLGNGAAFGGAGLQNPPEGATETVTLARSPPSICLGPRIIWSTVSILFLFFLPLFVTAAALLLDLPSLSSFFTHSFRRILVRTFFVARVYNSYRVTRVSYY